MKTEETHSLPVQFNVIDIYGVIIDTNIMYTLPAQSVYLLWKCVCQNLKVCLMLGDERTVVNLKTLTTYYL